MTEQPAKPSMAEQWETRYAASTKVWSGRPNATLTRVASTLSVGRALDLGCGEGADVIWLASQGWDAVGIDLSPTAVRRASAAARQAGVSGARFESADLNTWSDAGQFDQRIAVFGHLAAMVALRSVFNPEGRCSPSKMLPTGAACIERKTPGHRASA